MTCADSWSLINNHDSAGNNDLSALNHSVFLGKNAQQNQRLCNFWWHAPVSQLGSGLPVCSVFHFFFSKTSRDAISAPPDVFMSSSCLYLVFHNILVKMLQSGICSRFKPVRVPLQCPDTLPFFHLNHIFYWIYLILFLNRNTRQEENC